MTLEGDRVIVPPIKNGIESCNTDSQCNGETEPEKSKRKRLQKSKDSSINIHADTSALKGDSVGTNSCPESLVTINALTDLEIAVILVSIRNNNSSEYYNLDSQCNPEAEILPPVKKKSNRKLKDKDALNDGHVELKDDSIGTNSCHDSSVDINTHTDTKTAAFPEWSRKKRNTVRKKKRLNSSRVTSEVRASLAGCDSPGTKENALVSEKQGDFPGSLSASRVNKYNGGGPLIVVASVKRKKQMLDTSVITDKAHVPPAELDRSDEKNAFIYVKEIYCHGTPISNQGATNIFAEKENAETNHIEGKLRSNGKKIRKCFESIENLQSMTVAGVVSSNSDELHSTKISNNEVGGVQASKVSDIVRRLEESNLPMNVVENNEKDFGGIAFASCPNIEELGGAADAEVGDVENGYQGDPDPLENTDAEMEVEQIKSSWKNKKSEESRSRKLFKASLSDFVKEVLNPLWKKRDISREAYKTVVKKTVDKVLGLMKSHHVPNSKEKINKYIDSSE